MSVPDTCDIISLMTSEQTPTEFENQISAAKSLSTSVLASFQPALVL